MTQMLRTQLNEDAVMTVWLDQPGKSVNTFSPAALDELDALLSSIAAMKRKPAAIVFTSAKKGVFVSGADLFEMAEMDHTQMQRYLEQGQNLMDRIENLAVPTVAAINGHCLGGGLEFCLACTWRVAADDGSINIGLPEIKLGIIPAWGGTTRVTRMLGPSRALALLLTGSTMAPRRARSAGLVHEVVRPERLLAAGRRLAFQAAPAPARRSLLSAPGLCDLVCHLARRKSNAKTFHNYPASDALIGAVRSACRGGHDQGLRAEREAVMRLVDTPACQNLMRLFMLRHNAKRNLRLGRDGGAEPRPIRRAAVIGGGAMGSGIAHALIRSGIPVRLVDISQEAISAAMRRVDRMIQDDMKSKRLSRHQAQQAMHLLAPTAHWGDASDGTQTGLKLADLVVEAVAERMEIKQQVFAQLDRLTAADAILASNTSSLSITQIAESTENPSRVIGLHFFNPVPKMPLVEVVRTKHSSTQALQAAVQLAQRLGKTPLVVSDAPGFLVNRILVPYLAEALLMACEGASIAEVDLRMRKWGMPMGPFELLDQVGLDVAMSILDSLRGPLGDHLVVPEGAQRVIGNGNKALGRKTGRGFYDYRRHGRPRPNRDLIDSLRRCNGASRNGHVNGNDALDRLVLPMVNEAARALGEGVTDSAEVVDLATVLGLGLAPFRGGLLNFADSIGTDLIVARMERLQERYGARFAPTESLTRVLDGKEQKDRRLQITDH